jgi:hypothetical protein
VGRGFFLGGEETRAFEHDVDTQLAPGNQGRVALGEDADAVAIDEHIVAIDGDDAGKLAVHRVVARQMGVRLGVAQVVDGDDGDILLLAAFIKRAQDIAADAAIAIDGNFDGHAVSLLFYLKLSQWGQTRRV